MSGILSFSGRYRILHLTWFAFFLSFVVWFNFAPFGTEEYTIHRGRFWETSFQTLRAVNKFIGGITRDPQATKSA